MIIGVGIDVVDVARFAQSLARTPALTTRLFTDDEQRLPSASLAARFAAKEALAKALGAPVGLRWLDAEVHRGDDGRPHLRMSGTVAARAERARCTSYPPVPQPRRRHRLGGRRARGLSAMRSAYAVQDVRAAEQSVLAELPEGALMQRAAAGLARVCVLLLGKVYGSRVAVARRQRRQRR